MRNNFLKYPQTKFEKYYGIQKKILALWVVGNGGYPGEDLNLRQNSKLILFYFA